MADPASARVSFERRELPHAACPACASHGVRTFYQVRGIPVHSVLLMPTRAAALDYPRRDLDLAFCPSCGFVFNHVFDPSVHEYSTRYEETQGFSPTFSGFAKRLAQRLIDDYGLRDKRVLEIGCGKGEFLYLLATLGHNRGIGIDPAYVPGRLPPDADERIEFVQKLYAPEDTHHKADFVCHRHTLEHIADVFEHVEIIRRSLDGRTDVPFWVEVPGVERVLVEGAFWDIYYEHCSYFTLGALARLYRRVGFGVSELGTEYDDQYLVVGGTLDEHAGDREPVPGEDDLVETTCLVDAFAGRCGAMIDGWASRLRGIADSGGRAVVWGGGSKGVAFLTSLPADAGVEYAVDINPHKQGRFMPGTGHEVVGPEFLRTYEPTHAVVMNPIYCNEIRASLRGLGLDTEVVAVTEP